MSRIHEAITKAVRDREAKTSFESPSVEGILAAGYLAAREAVPVLAHAVLEQLPEEQPEQIPCTHLPWAPDEKRVLFFSERSDRVVREQIRSIRTKLNRLRDTRNLSVIATCSAVSGEGKTFVSVNLAYALAAQREQTVLLIDCDLRKGSVGKLLGARNAPGLAEYMLDQQPFSEVVQTGSNSRFYLIASGRRIAEPGELVSDSRFSALVQQCRKMFDWIIIDTPPAIQFSDASVIAHLCDGVVMVMKAGSTPVNIAKRAVQAFSESEILGAVLNHADIVESLSKYYSYY